MSTSNQRCRARLKRNKALQAARAETRLVVDRAEALIRSALQAGDPIPNLARALLHDGNRWLETDALEALAERLRGMSRSQIQSELFAGLTARRKGRELVDPESPEKGEKTTDHTPPPHFQRTFLQLVADQARRVNRHCNPRVPINP